MTLPVLQIVIGIGIGILGIGFLLFRQRSIEAPHQSTTGRENATFRTEPGEDCVICIEPMNISNIHYLPCRHAIHKKCFNNCRQHNSNKCPICRTPFVIPG